MSIAPIFVSPCDLANRLPAMVADFLDLEQHLKRRFREDSITDIIIASLLSLPGNKVVVMTPPEAKSGGDFDLIVVEPVSGDAVQFRIQAKRLSPNINDWTIGSYAELAHPHNSGTQSKTLVSGMGREPIPTIPLYAFYNPAHVCTASGGTVSGIELASGWEVRERVKALVSVKPKRLPFKRIGSLQPLFFPITTILCPPGQQLGVAMIPLPTEAQTAVVQAIEERSALAGFGQTLRIQTEALRTLTEPVNPSHRTLSPRRETSRERRATGPPIPTLIQAAIERREERIFTAKVKRPRVLLIAEASEK